MIRTNHSPLTTIILVPNTNPVVVVTAVGPGTGAAIVRRFAQGGYAVAMLARNRERGAQLERSRYQPMNRLKMKAATSASPNSNCNCPDRAIARLCASASASPETSRT